MCSCSQVRWEVEMKAEEDEFEQQQHVARQERGEGELLLLLLKRAFHLGRRFKMLMVMLLLHRKLQSGCK